MMMPPKTRAAGVTPNRRTIATIAAGSATATAYLKAGHTAYAAWIKWADERY